MPLTSQPGSEGRNIPAFNIKDFNFHINSSKIHIDLSGSVLAAVADAFVALFKSLIVDKINSSINNAVPGVMEKKLNSKLAGSDGFVHLKDNLFLDFSFASNPTISDSTMALYMNATSYDNTTNEYEIPEEDVSGDIKVLTSSKNSVQMSVSHYSASSFLKGLHEENMFEYLFSKEATPKLANELTTNYLDGLLPGIVEKYG